MALVAGDLPVSSDPVKASRSPSSKRRKSRSKGFGSPEYMRQTLRPVICLAFVLPLIFIHELGLINSDQLSGRSGIDQWLSWFLNLVGGGHLVVLPVVTAGTLLYFHHQLEDDWRFKPYVLFGMLAESFCLGAILFFAGNALYQMFSADYAANTTIAQASGLNAISCWSTTITYIGAGVYEEVIFRLLLLNGLIYVGKFYLSKTEAKFRHHFDQLDICSSSLPFLQSGRRWIWCSRLFLSLFCESYILFLVFVSRLWRSCRSACSLWHSDSGLIVKKISCDAAKVFLSTQFQKYFFSVNTNNRITNFSSSSNAIYL